MDDKKRYTIQVKGTAYKFRPVDLEAVGRLQVVSLMEVSPKATTKAVLQLVAQSMGDEQWDDLAARVMKGEVSLNEDLPPLVDKLIERMKKDLKSAKTSDDGE